MYVEAYETSSHESKFTYLCLRHFSRVLIYSRHMTILGTCYCKRQIDVSFYAFVLLLMINFVISIVKVAVVNFDNVKTKFIINKRTDA